MMRKHKVCRPRVTLASTAGLCAILLSGCTVPAHMRVDTHDHPALEDREVRYRTTYYFRVFDPCQSVTGNPGVDTLYRFRMTGKAHSLFSDVHFESGTLKASEIDPFGANVAFDAQNRRFSASTREQAEADARWETDFARLQRLLDVYEKTPRDQSDRKTKLNNLIDALVASMSGSNGALSEEQMVQLADVVQKAVNIAADEQKKLLEEIKEKLDNKITALPTTAGNCAQARGFQILGPEGFRTFAQDERLLLAMSSSGKPLISTLQELSNRVLDPAAPSAAEIELPLIREQLLLSRMDRALDGFDDSDDVQGSLVEALNGAINALVVNTPEDTQ